MTPRPAGAVLPLPEVIIACVDTRLPELGLRALGRCLEQVRPAAAVLFTDPAWRGTVPEGIRRLPLTIDSVPAYSHFMLRGLLAPLRALALDATHVLVVQWDGYVVDAAAWRAEFLGCDYIGAPWHDIAGDAAVGNGGFSLRSMRLLQALQDPALAPGHPEDVAICRVHRQALQQRGMRYAPRELAEHFACERTTPRGASFGFHGMFNFDRVMPLPELQALVADLPDALMRGLDAHDLCLRLIARGALEPARQIVAARRRLGMRDRRTWRLRARLALASLRHGPAAPAQEQARTDPGRGP